MHEFLIDENKPAIKSGSTQKQKWAHSVRENILLTEHHTLDTILKKIPHAEYLRREHRHFRAWLLKHDLADFWIDARATDSENPEAWEKALWSLRRQWEEETSYLKKHEAFISNSI